MATDLNLSPDTIRMFIQKARAASGAVEDGFEDGRDHEVEFDADMLEDTHAHDGLAEEEVEDLSSEELRELIDDLNVDEAAELVALLWVGRGDYDAADFPQAVEDARLEMARKLEETASLITEVTNVFNPEEDLAQTQKIADTQHRIKQATEAKQAEMKDIIRGAAPPARVRPRGAAQDRRRSMARGAAPRAIWRPSYSPTAHSTLSQATCGRSAASSMSA